MSHVDLSSSFDRALQLDSFQEGDWPACNWWVVFEDEQLDLLIAEALAENPDLGAARTRLFTAEQIGKQSHAAISPRIRWDFANDCERLSKNGSAYFHSAEQSHVIDEIRTGLCFDYELDFFAKRRERYRAALGQVQAERAELYQSFLIVTIGLAKEYFDFLANFSRVQLGEELVRARKAYAHLIEERTSRGLEDGIALERAKTLCLREEERLNGLQKGAALNRHALKALAGKSPDAEVKLEKPTAHFDRPFPLPPQLSIDLVARRPDLMAQIWRVEAAAHLVGAAKADFFPSVDLQAFFGVETLTFSKLLRAESLAPALTSAVHLPLFTGGRLRAQLGESRARFETAVQEYHALLLRAAREVVDQLRILQSIERDCSLQARAVSALERAFELASARYEYGVSDYLAVLRSQIELLDRRMEAIDLQNMRHLALLRLIQVLGGGYGSRGEER